MLNFEDLKDTALLTAQQAAAKAKSLAAIAKANLSIVNEEGKIRKAQMELGKLFYRDYVVGAEMDSAEYLPWCEKINESNAVIEDLRAMVDDLKSGADPDDVVVAQAESEEPLNETAEDENNAEQAETEE
ncbi:MAG: hypothetical protein IJT07_00085 [Oscillospiraceae bacterium]|nr:hypothetical protein [Oscillospiraceae bacterium]